LLVFFVLVELKVINNLRRSKLLHISKYSNLSESKPADKDWTVAFKTIAEYVNSIEYVDMYVEKHPYINSNKTDNMS